MRHLLHGRCCLLGDHAPEICGAELKRRRISETTRSTSWSRLKHALLIVENGRLKAHARPM